MECVSPTALLELEQNRPSKTIKKESEDPKWCVGKQWVMGGVRQTVHRDSCREWSGEGVLPADPTPKPRGGRDMSVLTTVALCLP